MSDEVTTFVTKPKPVFGYQFDGTVANGKTIIGWILSAGGEAKFSLTLEARDGDFLSEAYIFVSGAEGFEKAELGDWVLLTYDKVFLVVDQDTIDAEFTQLAIEKEESDGPVRLEADGN